MVSFKVEDRLDGKLVHLDGLNFSRAWALYRFEKFITFVRCIEEADLYSFEMFLSDPGVPGVRSMGPVLSH